MRQAVRNLTSPGCDLLSKCKYLLRNRDTKFTAGFDMIFRCADIEPTSLTARGSNLNAFAERFVRSIKEECLDRMIFFGEASLNHPVKEYAAHYHHERSHQGKENLNLFPQSASDPKPRDGPILCNKRLGKLLKHYYRKEAA